MSTSQQYIRKLRAIGHLLKPVVIIGDKGPSETVLQEIDCRLDDHELIKIRVNAETRDARSAIIDELVTRSKAQLIQRIGNTALLYRPMRKPDPKLSNILRHSPT